MELTIAERFDLHTRILEYIILNPEKFPDMIAPLRERRMELRPISAFHNTGFIARETFDEDKQRDMIVEIDIQNPGYVNIKYSIPINKSGQKELFNIAKAKITSSHYIIEDVIMNDYRDKHFFTSGEIEKIKVQIVHVTTMLLLYAYQTRMQYGLLSIPEEIDDITIIDNFNEKPSESEENDEKPSENDCESLNSIKNELENSLKIGLAKFSERMFMQHKQDIITETFNMLSNLALHDEKRIDTLEKEIKSLKKRVKNNGKSK